MSEKQIPPLVKFLVEGRQGVAPQESGEMMTTPLYCACGRVEDGDEHACPITYRRLKDTLERQRATIEFVNRQVRAWTPDWGAVMRWLDDSIALDGTPAPDQVDAYILFYEDAEVKPEHYSGAGAREAAWSRFRQASMSWSCHLFKRIAGTK